ncbi:MAG: MFS transporter, partial [Bacillota bacterium]
VLAWTNTYLAGMDVSPLASMYPIILYNVGIAIGRFSSGSVIRWSYRGVFIVGSIGAMISTVGSVVSDDVVLTALSLALAGLAHAALFPTAVAWGSELLPDNIGTSTGLLSMAVAAGSMVIPWLTGAVSDIVGLRLGILSVGIVSAAAMVLSVLLAGVRQSGAEHSDERALGA